MAEEVVAGLGVDAQQNRDKQNDGPGENCRQTGVLANHGKELARGLACRNPPGNHGSDPRGEGEGKQLAGEPAFNFGAGFLPDEIVPGEEGDGNSDPAIQSGLLVKPPPGAENEAGVVGESVTWEENEAYEAVTGHRD